jgi:oxygen-independent coproporphyrinogen-3 oxidase
MEEALLGELGISAMVQDACWGAFIWGTPSLMEPETVAALIARMRQRWPVADDLEITLEANPTSVEVRFAGWRAASTGYRAQSLMICVEIPRPAS